eukprot:531779-Prymnesium_polylepis.1
MGYSVRQRPVPPPRVSRVWLASGTVRMKGNHVAAAGQPSETGQTRAVAVGAAAASGLRAGRSAVLRMTRPSLLSAHSGVR